MIKFVLKCHIGKETVKVAVSNLKKRFFEKPTYMADNGECEYVSEFHYDLKFVWYWLVSWFHTNISKTSNKIVGIYIPLLKCLRGGNDLFLN